MIEEDNIVNKVVDKGKGLMIEEERPVPARKAMGRNKDLLDYLSEGEDELIQLWKRNSEAKRAPKVSKQKPCSDKEGGEGSSRPKTIYGLGESETILEHEEFIDDLVRKMRECDDDTELTDPFKLVEMELEKYPTHDQDTHWENKNQRSLKTQIIARCGQRPERIKDPKKGKLSKWKRYPSERQDEGAECPWRVGVIVNPDDQTYFDRFYVCFNGLKEGWEKGCRRVIALDGCFLKNPNVGEILMAIGRDGNNHVFPVAWAVVNVENKDNWSWFLELLGEDLELPTGNGLTLMSDQHKYAYLSLKVVKDEMPHAEHRQCARHVYEGFRKHYSGDVAAIKLPCSHEIAVIFKLNRRAEEYVPDCFRKRMFHDAYHQYLTPVGGMNFWPDCSEMSKGHYKSGCKNQIVLLPPKPSAKKVPPSVPIPPVEEHLGSSQYEFGGSSSTVNASKTKKMVTFKEHVANKGFSISGRGWGRGGGRCREREETMHDSEIQESQTLQTAPTQSLQTTASDGIAVDNQVVPVNELVPREPEPRARRNFVIPRQRGRSERILKKGLQRIT
ncbi:pentatricopeptide repeat-containing protein [Tanacetum coccineum]